MKLIRTINLNSVQENILFDCLKYNDIRYLIQIILSFKNPIELFNLETALSQLSDKHEILRAVVNIDDYMQPMMEIYDQSVCIIEKYNENVDIKYCLNKGLKSIDITAHPLHIGLVNINNISKVIITYHHIMLDGWSGANFISYLFNYYYFICNNIKIPNTSFSSYCKYITERQKQDLTAMRKFWSNYLKKCNPSVIGDLPETEQDGIYAYNSGFFIPFEQTLQIQSFLKENNTTIANYLIAAWSILLANVLNTSDVIFGYAFSGRTLPIAGIEHLLGVFFTCLPFRVQIHENTNLKNFLKQIQELSLEIMENQYLPLSDIHSLSNMSGKKLYNTVLTIDNYFQKINTVVLDKMRLTGIEFIEYSSVDLLVQVFLTDGIKVKITSRLQNSCHLTDRLAKLFEFYLRKLSEDIKELKETDIYGKF